MHCHQSPYTIISLQNDFLKQTTQSFTTNMDHRLVRSNLCFLQSIKLGRSLQILKSKTTISLLQRLTTVCFSEMICLKVFFPAVICLSFIWAGGIYATALWFTSPHTNWMQMTQAKFKTKQSTVHLQGTFGCKRFDLKRLKLFKTCLANQIHNGKVTAWWTVPNLLCGMHLFFSK